MGSAKVICVTGIDTDIGKSIVTGLLARFLLDAGKNVITQKICQTGCENVSDDILTHRKIMGIELQEADRQGLTCPYIFTEPCSPHLAAQLEGVDIDCSRISKATEELAEKYDYVIVEGVGGLLVPLLLDYTLIDYLADMKYSQILVSCSRLGSINHTLSALEIIKGRGLQTLGIVYNKFMDSNEKIAEDSARVFSHYLKKNGLGQIMVDLPFYQLETLLGMPDFSEFFLGDF
jgi:dethiobiotin synthetase